MKRPFEIKFNVEGYKVSINIIISKIEFKYPGTGEIGFYEVYTVDNVKFHINLLKIENKISSNDIRNFLAETGLNCVVRTNFSVQEYKDYIIWRYYK